ncbi:MAG TPA: sigma-70 family RNA polymerase sigma factor [Rhodospirillales bacterium]|jgi:RNA polymerase sigma-70 factor (ECF subfamily)|nr:sigma-70 family RNA polymerase sigma factor [Rhodospirillales bacterium]
MTRPALTDEVPIMLRLPQAPPAKTAGHDALVERIAADGDVDAFETIFRYYVPRLKAVGVGGGMPAAVAEELAQETMISLWCKAPSFERTRGGASRWIFAIFRNKRIDHLRRNPPCETALDEVLCLRSGDADPEEAADLNSIGRILRSALQALPPKQAEVLREVYFTGRSHSEVAERLNVPVGTVKSRIRLALARIRNALAPVGEMNRSLPSGSRGGHGDGRT